MKKIHRTGGTVDEYTKKLAEYKARYETCFIDIPESKNNETGFNWDGVFKIGMIFLILVSIGILIIIMSLLTGKV